MQLQPRRILWPTDFSPLSLHGGRYARAFQADFGAELHVIHVLPPPLSPDVAMMVPTEAPMALADPGLLDECRQSLENLINQHFGGDPSIRRDASFGNPWNVVCDYAKRNDIDLVIVSTHGRTGISHALIGSTAERIVQHAPCPVLTVKSPGRDFVA